MSFKLKVEQFLGLKSIAVTGVSSSKENPANLIFKKFRDADFTVYPVNPTALEVEGVQCFASLKDIPGGIEGVMIASPPNSAKEIIDDCIKLGIKHVWFHSSIDNGSLNEKAVKFAEENSIEVISSGCPMMYIPPVDFGHKCIKWILNLTGKVPRQ